MVTITLFSRMGTRRSETKQRGQGGNAAIRTNRGGKKTKNRKGTEKKTRGRQTRKDSMEILWPIRL